MNFEMFETQTRGTIIKVAALSAVQQSGHCRGLLADQNSLRPIAWSVVL